MKDRQRQLQAADPPDDWVDDSWTVDCICGVDFDDGEEMVKCDECGVWVHTRCSRYVKEEVLFACDKCKNKENGDDIEETEVAQVLVEFPTKTINIDSNNVANEPVRKPPLELWTEVPMEEKVHIQGIPGGDPRLFSGLSSVFSQQLWKCTGYVPRKFNFRYTEFPCWDADKEDAANVKEDRENTVFGKGSKILSSLPKERALGHPITTCMRTKTKGDDVNSDGKALPKEMKSELGGVDVICSQNGIRKEKNLHRSVIVCSGKRKKEESGTSDDTNGKRKTRIIDKVLDANGWTRHAPKPGI
ncbi:hypothetical protein SAY86_000873 [Trapa natans]|uniref:Zinc finger PHD-type domain-containing protein n=1 Tax=Trapa natans TaxID=22666 RepID=A0AAN7RH22_TRANT|nr:hypothetical protein SAY86_000873 [Trapa natans]